MKRMKKTLILLTMIAFAVLALPQKMLFVSAASPIANGKDGNITWEIDANGKLTVSGSGNFSNSLKPWKEYQDQIKSAVIDVKDMTNASGLFSGCKNLENVDLSNFDTSNVVNMGGMFRDCTSLTSLDLSRFDTSNVVDMSYMFLGCISLQSLDLSSFDTSNVTDVESMFSTCISLKSLDLSNFDTSSVRYLGYVFSGCSNLTSLNLSNFNTSNVTGMLCTFMDCENLKNLDLSNFDTSNMVCMSQVFACCSSLQNLNLSNFDTSSVEDMDAMFAWCSSLTSLDLSSFDTSNVTDMKNMFVGCSSLTSLDLSTFNMSDVANGQNMFYQCDNLSTIHTPYNLSESIILPDTGWHLPDGTEVTELPHNLNHSVIITRKPSSTIKDDQNNDNSYITDDKNNGQDDNLTWNDKDDKTQTDTDSGVLEGTGSSADSAVYGKRLLTAKPTDFKTILLSWEAAPNAKSYEIFYSTSPTGGFQRLANVKKTSYKFSKANCGVTYYFQMRVCEKKAKSEFGPVSYATTDLTGATTLQVKKTTYNSVQLKWNKIPGAKKYEIFYADSMDGNWQSLGVRGGTSFTHKKLVTGATYYYQVRPVRDSFRGSWSNGVSATTALGDVAGLKVKAAGSDRMKLSWKKVKGATQYVILRSESLNGTYETIGRSGRASYMDTGLPGGTTYFYKVYAVSGPYRTKETAPVGQTTRISK